MPIFVKGVDVLWGETTTIRIDETYKFNGYQGDTNIN